MALHYLPEVIEKIVLACLLAFIIVLLARAVLRFLLSPPGKDANDLRIVPMDGESAQFWTQRLGLVVIILAVSYATTLSLSLLGFSVEAREIVAYSLGLGLLGVGIDTVRRAPGPAIADAATDGEVFVRAKTSVGLISAYFVLLWCLWAFGAVQLFWLAAIAIGLVWAIAIAERIVVHLLQQPASPGIGAATPSAGATLLSRGIRFILIISG
ncbi:mechanosensitive ion channel family protein, partial [Rhizobium ruizarguesonis]